MYTQWPSFFVTRRSRLVWVGFCRLRVGFTLVLLVLPPEPTFVKIPCWNWLESKKIWNRRWFHVGSTLVPRWLDVGSLILCRLVGSRSYLCWFCVGSISYQNRRGPTRYHTVLNSRINFVLVGFTLVFVG